MEQMDNYKLRVDNIINNYKDLIFKNPNIIGFGRGLKIIGNQWTKTPSLTIFVKKKVSLDALDRDKIIPKYFNGILTDIEETGEFNETTSSPAYSSMSATELMSGMNIGNTAHSYGGTITCGFYGQLKKDEPKRMFILGCASALAQINLETGVIGRIGDYIANHGKYSNKIGRIVDIGPLDIGINKKPTYSNTDAVLILLEENIKVMPGFNSGGRIYGTTKTAPGVKVYYEGSGSGKQFGIVKTVSTVSEYNKGNIKINYSPSISVEVKHSMEDRGAMGVVTTMSKKDLGFGMLVAGTEKIGIFTDLDESINHFKNNFKLELIY